MDSGTCTGMVIVFVDGKGRGSAEEVLLLSISASRLVGDRLCVESELCTDILGSELEGDGMDRVRVLLQRLLLGSYEVGSGLSRSKYAELDCIRD